LSFLARCALIAWLSSGCLAVVDRRTSAAAYQLLLSLAAWLLSARGWFIAEGHGWGWGLASLAGALWTLNAARRWLDAAPRELHQESLPAEPRRARASRRARANGKTETAGVIPRRMGQFDLMLFGLGIAGTLLAVWPHDLLATRMPTSVQMAVIGHFLASSGLLAVSLVVAIELTILSSPDSLAREPQVAWRRLAIWALGLAGIELLVSLAVLTDYTATAQSDRLSRAIVVSSEELLIQRVFALALTVCAGIAWAVPHRVASFQRRSEVPQDWVSLAMASWLVCLAMTVVCLLPLGWPIVLDFSAG
jgi:hypothetical protein